MLTRTENFARDCCASYYKVDRAAVDQNVDNLKSVSWIIWIELVMSILQSVIENCPQRNLLPKIMGSGLSRWQTVKFRRTAMNQAVGPCEMYRRDSFDIAEAVTACGGGKKEEELQEVVDEVTNPDNWLF